jgi:hypothetical protein
VGWLTLQVFMDSCPFQGFAMIIFWSVGRRFPRLGLCHVISPPEPGHSLRRRLDRCRPDDGSGKDPSRSVNGGREAVGLEAARQCDAPNGKLLKAFLQGPRARKLKGFGIGADKEGIKKPPKGRPFFPSGVPHGCAHPGELASKRLGERESQVTFKVQIHASRRGILRIKGGWSQLDVEQPVLEVWDPLSDRSMSCGVGARTASDRKPNW